MVFSRGDSRAHLFLGSPERCTLATCRLVSSSVSGVASRPTTDYFLPRHLAAWHQPAPPLSQHGSAVAVPCFTRLLLRRVPPLRPGRAVTLRYDRARMWSVVLLRLTHNLHGARRSPHGPASKLALSTRIRCGCCLMHRRSAHVYISDTNRRVVVVCRRLSLWSYGLVRRCGVSFVVALRPYDLYLSIARAVFTDGWSRILRLCSSAACLA